MPAANGNASVKKRILLLWGALICFGILYFILWRHFTQRPNRHLPSAAGQSAPRAGFQEITAASGIRFRHYNGATGEKLLPETMGPGVAIFDFNNDGAQDIFFVNGRSWPWNSQADAEKKATSSLYKNNGEASFTDATAEAGLEIEHYGMGAAVGDIDNDGWVDLLVTGVGGCRLFRNREGKFQEITESAGLAGKKDQWSTSAGFFDYDNDGLLDLFVCHYVTWSKEIDLQLNYTLPQIGRSYGPPMQFQGTFCALYHNEGNGRFRDVSTRAGIEIRNPVTGLPMAKALGLAPIDLDQDGWMDLIVANDTVQNFVFHNQRNGTFREVGASSGIGYDPHGTPRGAMGIDSGRFQEDNSLGISIGNFANEMTALYVSTRNPLIFTDEAISQGIGGASREALTFGVFFFDYDLDGWLDLLTVNGHIEPQIEKVGQGQKYEQPALLFWNGRGKQMANFQLVPPEKAGPDLYRPVPGRGSAFGDLDNDGDLDVVITAVNSAPLLLRNELQEPREWIRLKLVGTRDNRDAVGAVCTLRLSGVEFSQQVMPTRSYLSQSESVLTFGWRKGKKLESISIRWPGGQVQQVPLPALKKLTTIKQAGA
jgi:hypothetical protein